MIISHLIFPITPWVMNTNALGVSELFTFGGWFNKDFVNCLLSSYSTCYPAWNSRIVTVFPCMEEEKNKQVFYYRHAHERLTLLMPHCTLGFVANTSRTCQPTSDRGVISWEEFQANPTSSCVAGIPPQKQAPSLSVFCPRGSPQCRGCWILGGQSQPQGSSCFGSNPQPMGVKSKCIQAATLPFRL